MYDNYLNIKTHKTVEFGYRPKLSLCVLYNKNIR